MEFKDYYHRTRKEINSRLATIFKEEVEDQDFHDMLHYAVKGGKRFRPTLTMLMFDMLGGKQRQRALTHAAIIELIHEASLAQDDALDYDKIRRGKDSVWMRLLKKATRGLNNLLPTGLPKELSPRTISTLMAGNVVSADGILAFGLRLLDDPEVMRAFSEGILSLSKGAIKEVDNMLIDQLFGTSKDKYKSIIKGKTASLFATSTHVGAISASASRAEKENARQLGLHLGMCYQVADDLSEGDLPRGINGQELLSKEATNYDRILARFDKNDYRDMFAELLLFMVNKLMAEEDYDQQLVRVEPEVFKWQATASTN